VRFPKSDFICLVIVAVDQVDGSRHFFNQDLDLGWVREEHQCWPYFPPNRPELPRRHLCPPLPSGHKWKKHVVPFDITDKRLVEGGLT
jgi:hypothetical protein